MPTRRSLCLSALLALLLLPGCAGQKSAVHFEHEQAVELAGTPFHPQSKYQCGPASLAMLLGASGVTADPLALASSVYLPGRRGSLQLELISASRRHGRIPYTIDGQVSAIISELQAGRPVLVLQNLGLNIIPVYHYAVVIGAVSPDKIVLRSGVTRRLLMDVDHFLATWRRTGSWGMILLNPGALPANPDPVRFLAAVNAFELSGQIISAEPAYRAARMAWPDNQTALFALGNNLLLQARYREAGSVFRELLVINPEHVAAANNLAEVLVRQGCYLQAQTVIGQAVETAERINSPLSPMILETQQQIREKIDRIRPDEKKECGDDTDLDTIQNNSR